MILITGAANRDERQFDDPDALRVDRDLKLHLAIAHAKKSNLMELQEADTSSADAKSTGPLLSIAR